MRLYENAKRDQWDSTTRLDWSIDVDPHSELVPDMGIGIFGSRCGTKLTAKERERLRHEAITWQLSQFLHGEQGALLATAQLVDAVPWYEGKLYAATQVIDEARHVEVYNRYVHEKMQLEYPINPHLKKLLDLILNDSRWDMKFLGMQIMVEGLALAAFGDDPRHHDQAAAPRSHRRGDGRRGAPRRVRRALAARVLHRPRRARTASSARTSSTRPPC